MAFGMFLERFGTVGDVLGRFGGKLLRGCREVVGKLLDGLGEAFRSFVERENKQLIKNVSRHKQPIATY